MINAVSVSMVAPGHLGLGVTCESWLSLFSVRSFSSACQLFLDIQENSWSQATLLVALQQHPPSQHLPCMQLFGGVAADLMALVLTLSPLDKLQLMTSAFRKASAALASLKLSDNENSTHCESTTNSQVFLGRCGNYISGRCASAR